MQASTCTFHAGKLNGLAEEDLSTHVPPLGPGKRCRGGKSPSFMISVEMQQQLLEDIKGSQFPSFPDRVQQASTFFAK